MRIGILAPPWCPVPPDAYGGTESVIDRLKEVLGNHPGPTQVFLHLVRGEERTVLRLGSEYWVDTGNGPSVAPPLCQSRLRAGLLVRSLSRWKAPLRIS